EWVFPGVSRKVGRSVCSSQMTGPFPKKRRIFRREGPNRLLTFRCIFNFSDAWTVIRKKLDIGYLKSVPGRITKYAIKSASRKDFRKRQVPVEELVLIRQPLDL